MTADASPADHPTLQRPAAQQAPEDGLEATRALSGSRLRWQSFARLAAELVFELDEKGCFAYLDGAAEHVLGRPAEELLGHAASALVAPGSELPGFNPFMPPDRLARHRLWLRRPDGSTGCATLSAEPVRDPGGRRTGTRGTLSDVTEQERRERQVGHQLLTHQTIEQISRRMRGTVLPGMTLRIGLEELINALGASGALLAACDVGAPRAGERTDQTRTLPRILHRAGSTPPAADPAILSWLSNCVASRDFPWTKAADEFGHHLLVSAAGSHFCEPVLLLVWREQTRDWIDGDAALVAGFLAAATRVLDHDQVQAEVARQSRSDALTGLLNRESLVSEIGRRLDRLDKEGLAGTLMIVGLDRFGAVNDRHGHESGDAVLRQAARILRDTVRPTDLVARLSGDVFALWLDGADQFVAAERAETLCQHGVAAMLDEPVRLGVSIGLSTRPSRSFESLETLLEQANAALNAIKLAGGGRWHVYNEGI